LKALSENRKATVTSGGPPQSPPEATFESAFDALQRVVEQLETGGLDLDTALHLFDRGMTLAQTCERLVADAELRVTRLTSETASALSDA
jgi:exodeoxyribonuclease VII small subunit